MIRFGNLHKRERKASRPRRGYLPKNFFLLPGVWDRVWADGHQQGVHCPPAPQAHLHSAALWGGRDCRSAGFAKLSIRQRTKKRDLSGCGWLFPRNKFLSILFVCWQDLKDSCWQETDKIIVSLEPYILVDNLTHSSFFVLAIDIWTTRWFVSENRLFSQSMGESCHIFSTLTFQDS